MKAFSTKTRWATLAVILAGHSCGLLSAAGAGLDFDSAFETIHKELIEQGVDPAKAAALAARHAARLSGIATVPVSNPVVPPTAASGNPPPTGGTGDGGDSSQAMPNERGRRETASQSGGSSRREADNGATKENGGSRQTGEKDPGGQGAQANPASGRSGRTAGSAPSRERGGEQATASDIKKSADAVGTNSVVAANMAANKILETKAAPLLTNSLGVAFLGMANAQTNLHGAGVSLTNATHLMKVDQAKQQELLTVISDLATKVDGIAKKKSSGYESQIVDLQNAVADLRDQVTRNPAVAEEFNNAAVQLNEAADRVGKAVKEASEQKAFSPRAFFHGGWMTLNPYKLVGTNGGPYKLDSDSSTSVPYLEFQLNQRWAWEWQATDTDSLHIGFINWGNRPTNSITRWLPYTVDLQSRFGYTFVDSEQGREVSSVVGGGNLNLEFSVGVPVVMVQSPNYRRSLDLEVSYGAVTDRKDFDIHSSGFIGFAYHSSIGSSLFGTNRALFSAHFGTGFVEVPRFVDADNGLVGTHLGGIPDFESHWGIFASAVELMIPLNGTTYIVAGGRLYANADPNPWTAYIGISRQIDGLNSIFK